MSAVLSYRLYELPWHAGGPAEARFRRILRNAFIVYAVVALVMPFLPLVKPERLQAPEIPERVVNLILEQSKPPPPPPPVVERPRLQPQPQPQTRPEPRVARSEPQPAVSRPEPVERREELRHRLRNTGLLAMQDELAALRDTQASTKLAAGRQLGTVTGDAPQVERSMITANTGKGSGGINTAALSRNTGGGGLAGRDTTRVTSNLAGMAAAADTSPRGASGKPSRSREEIEMVFDQNKGAIYALYSRALRRDPSLQGKLVLQLTIEPSGVVSACEVLSSELDDAELLQKLVTRVRMFRFEARDVAEVTTTKPIDFFPA
ncbi:MAG: AgmX/PglI C-terminal domain-containing protein [Gammaproteobacteria bacterium]|nr:AgmX/PglI C-terminal domain-containing protein [Gammaproteobacteria bacterium]